MNVVGWRRHCWLDWILWCHACVRAEKVKNESSLLFVASFVVPVNFVWSCNFMTCWGQVGKMQKWQCLLSCLLEPKFSLLEMGCAVVKTPVVCDETMDCKWPYDFPTNTTTRLPVCQQLFFNPHSQTECAVPLVASRATRHRSSVVKDVQTDGTRGVQLLLLFK